MWSLVRRTAAALLALGAVAAPLAAQTAVYDFEGVPPVAFNAPPFCLTNAGIGACFTVDAVEPPGGPAAEPGFFGTMIHSFYDWVTPAPARMTIAFDRELVGISFPFQFRPFAATPHLVVTLEAFDAGTPVGTCAVPSSAAIIGIVDGEPRDFGEIGQLQCAPGVFNSVVITGDPRGGNLWVDNVQVAAAPEPGTVLLLATGLVALGAVARRRRATGG